ncbi:Tetraacyldisaccharide 4'-kinase [Candidatus Hepatincolaceae symbiont of Richtersius coronifer]
MLFKLTSSFNIHKVWQKKSFISYLLIPFSLLWVLGTYLRNLKKPYESNIFTICLGNINLGGSGKTPSAIYLGQQLSQQIPKVKIAFLSKGYKSKLQGPLWVIPQSQTLNNPQDVGDEPLLLAQVLPTLIAKNLKQGLRFLEQENFDLVIIDDGLQNPNINKNFRILVINGNYGFGNQRIFPAGPLREKINFRLSNVDFILLLEEDKKAITSLIKQFQVPFTTGAYKPSNFLSPISAQAKGFYAFCGIGMPEKFLLTLRQSNVVVKLFKAFPDHYQYQDKDLEALSNYAQQNQLQLITTAKDYVKIPKAYKKNIISFNIKLELDNKDILLDTILKQYLTFKTRANYDKN